MGYWLACAVATLKWSHGVPGHPAPNPVMVRCQLWAWRCRWCESEYSTCNITSCTTESCLHFTCIIHLVVIWVRMVSIHVDICFICSTTAVPFTSYNTAKEYSTNSHSIERASCTVDLELSTQTRSNAAALPARDGCRGQFVVTHVRKTFGKKQKNMHARTACQSTN